MMPRIRPLCSEFLKRCIGGASISSLAFGVFAVASVANAGTFRIPEYASQQLTNGVMVDFLKHGDVPLINMIVSLEVGSNQDQGLSGLASLMGHSFELGTDHLTKEQIEEKFDFWGASWQVTVGKERTTMAASFSQTDFKEMSHILASILQKPAFPNKKFEELKAKTLTELEQSYESPRDVIFNYFNGSLFKGTMYASPVVGIPQSLKQITRHHVEEFYKNYVHPQRTRITLVGLFDPETVLQTLQRDFGSWTPAKSPKPIVVEDLSKRAPSGGVVIVDKPDAGQATFLIGGSGLAKGDPLHIEAGMINTLLGGRFTSWLNQALRIDSGLTYGANSRFVGYKTGGSFVMSSFTKTESTGAAIALALKTYSRLHQDPVSQQELESAKKYQIGQFPLSFETSEDLANAFSEWAFYGIPVRRIQEFESVLQNFTPSRASNLIQTAFPKEPFWIIVIGRSQDLRQELKKFGAITEYKLSLHGSDLK